LGSFHFAKIIIFTCFVSNLLLILVQRQSNNCLLGFSGILFGLQAIETYIYREGLEGQFYIWGEMLIIHLLVPNSSLSGHLCGLFSGYIYIWILQYNQQRNEEFHLGTSKSKKSIYYFLLFCFVITIGLFTWNRYDGSMQRLLRDLLQDSKDFLEDLSNGDLFYLSKKNLKRWWRRNQPEFLMDNIWLDSIFDSIANSYDSVINSWIISWMEEFTNQNLKMNVSRTSCLLALVLLLIVIIRTLYATFHTTEEEKYTVPVDYTVLAHAAESRANRKNSQSR